MNTPVGGTVQKSTLLRRPHIGVAAAIAIFTVVNLIWIVLDEAVWPWDQAWYGEVALNLWHARRDGLEAWWAAMLHALPSKPPLLPWLSQFLLPFTRLSLTPESALLLINVSLGSGTLWVVYGAAIEFKASILEKLAGVLLCAGMPMFIAMTHEFMVEQLQGFIVAAMVLLAVKSKSISRRRSVGLCVLLTSLGFLVKTTSELFILPLSIYVAFVIWFKPQRATGKRDISEIVIYVIAVAITCVMVTWYWINWQSLVQHFKNATTSEWALWYGSPVILSSKFSFWLKTFGAVMAPNPFVAIMVFSLSFYCIGLALCHVGRARFTVWCNAMIDSDALLSIGLIGIVVGALVAYSLQINEDPRFLMPLLPIVAVLFVWSLSMLRIRLISGLALSAVIINAVVNHAYAFGVNPLETQQTAWLRPIKFSVHEKSVLTYVVDATCAQPIAFRFTIIGVEYERFSANAAAFYSAKQRRIRGYRCNYTSLGYAQNSMEQAIRWLNQLRPEYFVTIRPNKQDMPNFLNVVSRPFAEYVARDPRFVFDSRSSGDVLIYRVRN